MTEFRPHMRLRLYTRRSHAFVESNSTGSNTTTTLNDTGQAWTTNQWAGFLVRIIRGKGEGQQREIASNTATQLTVSTAWNLNETPDATSVYQIINSDEDNVLVPHATAPHQDAFLLSTVEHTGSVKVNGITASRTYRPYLGFPRGKRGAINFLTKQLETGALSVPLLDVKVGQPSDNSRRWATAFVGDGHGQNPIKGARVEIDIMTDPDLDPDVDANWDRYFTGRVNNQALDGRVRQNLDIRDMADDLGFTIFEDLPHSSIDYVFIPPLLPAAALIENYGPYQAKPWPRAVVRTFSANVSGAPSRSLEIDERFLAEQIHREANRIHDGYPNLIDSGSGRPWLQGDESVRVRIKMLEGANAGQEGEFFMWHCRDGQIAEREGKMYLRKILISPTLDVGSPFWRDLSWLTVGDDCEFYVYLKEGAPLGLGNIIDFTLPPIGGLPGGTGPFFGADLGPIRAGRVNIPIDKKNPLFINDKHVVAAIRDALDGKFGRATPDGSILWSIPKNDVDGAFAPGGLIDDTSLVTGRWIVRAKQKLNEWVEKQLKGWQLGWFIDRFGRVDLVDLRRPTPAQVLAAPTLTNTDIIAVSAPEWSGSRDGTINDAKVRVVMEEQRAAHEIEQDKSRILSYEPGGFVEADAFIHVMRGNSIRDMGHFPYSFDADGWRTTADETWFALGLNISRLTKIKNDMLENLHAILDPHYTGPDVIVLTCRRTATVVALNPGSLVKVNVDEIPNASTMMRGGTRVGRVVEMYEDGMPVVVQILDLGPDTQASVPSVGNPALETGNEKHGVTFTVTPAAAGDVLEVWVAVTPTSTGTRPAETSPLWRMVKRIDSAKSGANTITVGELPAGSRVWPRARTMATATQPQMVPSAFAFPATASVDTNALGQPGSITMTGVDGTGSPEGGTARGTWTNTETEFEIEVYIDAAACPGTQDDTTRYATLQAGSTRVDLYGLTPSTTHCLAIRYRDRFGGLGAFRTVQFTTSATRLTAEAPADIVVMSGVPC